ncbi:uncharacterized protein LOC127002723 [Eriocheir sinensis]|uniref:uncharacterized protein LOC127002723 n=1 Tax=Eriocheir sinensis TaxID=95602 RepID=UPI0021C7469E|nr:uncharacterized protein LOC127002723 [Eriocheir sinensis]XP_050724766.1 uncharacterized protein LOC127002723 [Eriocheir sinensis]XP_050724768.1 uncharacterized protein LOC127002723 [Eriocheir sinensis]
MEPTSTSDMDDSSDTVQQLRKRIGISSSLSIFKVPRPKSAAQKHPKQGTARVGDDARECRRPTECHQEHQQVRQAEATVRQGREDHGAYEQECKMDASHEGAARPTDRGWFRELADIGVNTPTTTHSLLVGPSASYLLTSRTGGNTQLHRNMIQGVPVLSRVLGSQHSPYSVPRCSLAEGGTSDKEHCFALYQNCQHKLAQGANNNFQQPGGVPFLVDKGTQSQSQRGSQRRVQPGQPSPSSELGSSKQTKIMILFPAMPEKDENQLITIFSEISRLHGCEFSMDKKDCTLRKVTSNPPPVRHPSATSQQATPAESVAKRKPPVRHPSATSQQATPVESVSKRKPQDTAGRRQRPAPSHQWAFLQNLQARLLAVGTQLEAIDMTWESPGESSDSDDSLPLFPEVVMGTSPPPT